MTQLSKTDCTNTIKPDLVVGFVAFAIRFHQLDAGGFFREIQIPMLNYLAVTNETGVFARTIKRMVDKCAFPAPLQLTGESVGEVWADIFVRARKRFTRSDAARTAQHFQGVHHDK